MLNGNFKIGTDRSNRNQIKRTADRFGDEFILAKAAELVELVRSGNVKYSEHLIKKMRRDNLNVPTIVIAKTIAHAKTSFIEFSYLRGNCKWHRALLRDYTTVEDVMIDGEIKKCNLCFAIDFNCGETLRYRIMVVQQPHKLHSPSSNLGTATIETTRLVKHFTNLYL